MSHEKGMHLSKRLSTPLVLGAASTMLSLGLVGFYFSGRPSTHIAEVSLRVPAVISIVDTTPEAAAESMYDAWRKRAWLQALTLSESPLRETLLGKQAEDAALAGPEREMAADVWARVAASPLRIRYLGSERDGDDYELDAIAGYNFMGRPYERRVHFRVVHRGQHYRVTRMDFGETLSEPSALLRGLE